MVPVNRNNDPKPPTTPADGTAPTSASDPTTPKEPSASTESESGGNTDEEPKGDPEMAPVYLKRLLPVFTQVYQRTMISSVR